MNIAIKDHLKALIPPDPSFAKGGEGEQEFLKVPRPLGEQGGFMLASEKPDELGWRDRGCNQEWFDRPSDGRG